MLIGRTNGGGGGGGVFKEGLNTDTEVPLFKLKFDHNT